MMLAAIIASFLALRGYRRYKRYRRMKAALPLLFHSKPVPTLQEILDDPDIRVLPHHAVDRINVIGRGGQGVVWKGTLRQNNGSLIDVAVKEAHLTNQTDLQMFLTGKYPRNGNTTVYANAPSLRCRDKDQLPPVTS